MALDKSLFGELLLAVGAGHLGVRVVLTLVTLVQLGLETVWEDSVA